MRWIVCACALVVLAGCATGPTTKVELTTPSGEKKDVQVLGLLHNEYVLVPKSQAPAAAAQASAPAPSGEAKPAAAAPAQPAVPAAAAPSNGGVAPADRKFRLVREGERVTTSGQRFKKACFFGHPGSDEDPVYATIGADGSFTIPKAAVQNGLIFFNLVGAVGASEHVTSDGWLKITEESVAESGRICYSGGLAPWVFNERDGAGNVRKVRCFALAEFVENRDGAE